MENKQNTPLLSVLNRLASPAGIAATSISGTMYYLRVYSVLLGAPRVPKAGQSTFAEDVAEVVEGFIRKGHPGPGNTRG